MEYPNGPKDHPNIKDLIAIENRIVNNIYQQNQEIESLVKKIHLTNSKSTKKDLQFRIEALKNELKKYMVRMDDMLASYIFGRFMRMETYKDDKTDTLDDMYLYEIKELFILLSRCGIDNKHYLHVPPSLFNRGMYAGILEDLVYVLRNPTEFDLKPIHLQEEVEIIDTLTVHCSRHSGSKSHHNITFMRYLIKSNTYEDVIGTIRKAVLNQGEEKRVSVKKYENSNQILYYAHRGLEKGIIYDPRLVVTVTPKLYKDNTKMFPEYVVHFIREDIGLRIWEADEGLTDKRLQMGESYPGSICNISKSIIVTPCRIRSKDKGKEKDVEESKVESDVLYTDQDMFYISPKYANLRDKFNYGVKGTSKKNYTSGLIINFGRMVNTLDSGAIQINELDTILVHQNIPETCIVGFIRGEELENFWKVDE